MCAAGLFISTRSSMLTLIASVVSCVCLGCREPKRAAPAKTRAIDFGWQEQPLGGVASRAAEPVPVKEGSAPLLYLAEMPQTIRVVDRTANRFVAEAVVARRTIVRVDERTGVVAGKEMLVPGPLPAGRRYTIYMVPEENSFSRSGRFQPIPQRKPKSENLNAEPPLSEKRQ